MNEFFGKKIVVIGLARAGLSMAKALKSVGAQVSVVDQKSADSPALFQPLDQLSALDIPVTTGWAGDLDWNEIDIVAPSPGVPRNHPTLKEASNRRLPIFSEMEIGYRLSRAPIIAITGTNGKSTVTALTHHLLVYAGKSAVLCGNIAGSGYHETTICEAAVRSNESDILVAEVSSFQLEWIEKFRPKAATITQITQDHLDRYRTFEEYASFKMRIYQNMGIGDTIVLNKFRQETTPGPTQAAILSIGEFGSSAEILEGTLRFSGSNVEVRMEDLWVPGRHSLANLATATLLASPFGMTPEIAAEGVKSFIGLQNRMELIGVQDGVKFINNSMCTNPSAVEASLDGIDGNILLLAGGINKVQDLAPFTRTSPKIKAAYLFGRDAAEIGKALEDGGCKTERFTTMEEAFSVAVSRAEPGDSVVLSPGCSSFDQFQDFIDRGDKFRELVGGAIKV